MDIKRFKKTYKFICDDCGEFMHTKTEYCEKCGSNNMRKAKHDDYIKYETKQKSDLAQERAVVKAERVEKRAEEKAERAEKRAVEKAERAEKRAVEKAEKAEEKE
ncbi:MAG: hypothetical protein ACFFDY_11855 [Candidatus Thorarchaeota archaeon]